MDKLNVYYIDSKLYIIESRNPSEKNNIQSNLHITESIIGVIESNEYHFG